MSCDTIPTYNFCTVHGDTVFDKEFTAPEFDDTFTLRIDIFTGQYDKFAQFNTKIQSIVLDRVSSNKFTWPEHKETMKSGGYSYTLCYIKGNVERLLLRGKITVKNH